MVRDITLTRQSHAATSAFSFIFVNFLVLIAASAANVNCQLLKP